MKTLRNLRNNTIWEGKEDLLKTEKMKYYTSPDWQNTGKMDTFIVSPDPESDHTVGQESHLSCPDIPKHIESFIRSKSSDIIVMAGDVTITFKKSDLQALAVNPYDNVRASIAGEDGDADVYIRCADKDERDDIQAESRFNESYGILLEKGGGDMPSLATMGIGGAAALFTQGMMGFLSSDPNATIFTLAASTIGSVIGLGIGIGSVISNKQKEKKASEKKFQEMRTATIAAMGDGEVGKGVNMSVMQMFYTPEGDPRSMEDIRKSMKDVPKEQIDSFKKKADGYMKDPKNVDAMKKYSEWSAGLSDADRKAMEDNAMYQFKVASARDSMLAQDKVIEKMEKEINDLEAKGSADDKSYIKTLKKNLQKEKDKRRETESTLSSAREGLEKSKEAAEKVRKSAPQSVKSSMKDPKEMKADLQSMRKMMASGIGPDGNEMADDQKAALQKDIDKAEKSMIAKMKKDYVKKHPDLRDKDDLDVVKAMLDDSDLKMDDDTIGAMKKEKESIEKRREISGSREEISGSGEPKAGPGNPGKPVDDDKPGDDEDGDEEHETEETDPDTGRKIKVSVQSKRGKRGGKYFRTRREGNNHWSEWQSGVYGKN